MPTNRTRRRQERRSGLRLDPDILRELLVAGGSYFCDETAISNDELRAIWIEHRDEILAIWRDEHGAGSRPFAWWLFEAIPKFGERRVLPGSECLIEHRDGWTKRGVLHTNLTPPGQETEIEFLRRHALLDEDEV